DAELLRSDVIETADLFSPAARQPCARRSRDAIRREVTRTEGEVIGHREVPVPRSVVRRVDGETRPQLVLQRDRALPVVAAMAEPGERLVSQPRLVRRQTELRGR